MLLNRLPEIIIKKRRQVVLLLLLMCAARLAGAQTQMYLGLQTGLALSNFQLIKITPPTTLRPGSLGEVTGDFSLGKKLSLMASLGYVEQGSFYYGMSLVNNLDFTSKFTHGRDVYGYLNNNTTLGYIRLGLELKHTLLASSVTGWYVHGGGYFAGLAQANLHQYAQGCTFFPTYGWGTYDVQNVDIKENISAAFPGPDAGLLIGTGLARVVDHGNIFIDISGSYGLLNILYLPYSGASITNYSGFIKVGYSYALK